VKTSWFRFLGSMFHARAELESRMALDRRARAGSTAALRLHLWFRRLLVVLGTMEKIVKR
jgi:hypothetical protein